MATTTPLRWLRRVRQRSSRGGVLAAFCLLMGLVVGLVASGWEARTAESQPTAAPSGSLEVGQTLLCPGTIVVQLRNNGAQPVTIAQVSVNDAFWPFTARPSTTIAPHRTASVTLRYPWDAGVAYEVQFISSTGATYVTDIDASTTASAPPCPERDSDLPVHLLGRRSA
jgi:zinc transporter, ZIP family